MKRDPTATIKALRDIADDLEKGLVELQHFEVQNHLARTDEGKFQPSGNQTFTLNTFRRR